MTTTVGNSLRNIFNTVTEIDSAIASGFSVGQKIQLLGRDSLNDGFGGEYIVVAANTGTPDNFRFIDIPNSLQLQRLGGGLAGINDEVSQNRRIGGLPFAANLLDSNIEIVAGSVRQDGNNPVTITRTGSVATVTQADHGYATGDLLYIRGANQPEYNVSSVALTVVDSNTYTFAVSGSPVTPATTSQDNIVASVPKYWDYILDPLHTPVGCDLNVRIEANGSRLPVPFAETYSRVLALLVNPDETLSNALNMTAGPSVGLSNIDIQASINVTLAAHVWYDGADWQWSFGPGQGGTAPHNVDIEEVVFPSNGNVEVRHTNCPGIDVRVMGFSRLGNVAPYIPVVRAASDSTLFLNFQDTGGTLRSDSTPNTSHSFHISKNFSEGIRLDGQGSFDFDLYLGNIWFYGIFEV